MTRRPTTTAEWRQLDARHHLHPFTDFKALAAKGSRIVTRGDGVYLWDSDGNRILDAMAGLWCVNLGYGRAELAEVAAQQMRTLPYYNTFFQTATEPSIELAAKLAELTPEGLKHVFYASSGSEANDSIIKIVRYFWNLQGKPSKKIIIGRDYAYHGTTLGAASVSGLKPMHPQADLPLPGFVHIPAPYWYDEGGDKDEVDFGLERARALEDKILELGPENVGAFFGEPVQGAGGLIVPPPGYWREIQRICRKYDVLLVADEVICGFGRTGRWFGSDTFDIRPDMMTLAKGLTSGYVPMAAVMVGDRVAETLFEKGGEFVHGFTYSGHPVAAAVAIENLRLLEEEKVVEKVGGETGPYFQARLRELEDHPLVGQARGVGMLGALELVKDKKTRARFDNVGEVGTICRDHCFANGLVMRAVRDTMVISPPLIITTEQIDEFAELARRCLDLTARDLGIAV